MNFYLFCEDNVFKNLLPSHLSFAEEFISFNSQFKYPISLVHKSRLLYKNKDFHIQN